MKNKKITRKISQGMYVLTTEGGGCVVDAVIQASAGDNPIIAVAICKDNHTHQLLQKNSTFAISVLGKDADGEIIKQFGFNCSRDVDKFEGIETIEVKNTKVVKKSLGYIILEKVDSIDCGTHTLFLGKMIEGDILEDEEPMTYAEYQENKEDLLKITTEKGKTAWICTACGYIYYGDEVPDDFICPICKLGKSYFKEKDD